MEGINVIPWSESPFRKHKSIEEIEEGIDKISKIENLDTLNYENLHARFYEIFQTYPIHVFHLNKDFLKTLKVYRVRPSDKNINEISNPDTFSSPPWNKNLGKFGRANWRGKNVFYGSDTAHTALREAQNQYIEGNEFYVAKWGFDFNKFTTGQIRFSTFVFDIPKENPWYAFVEDFKKKHIEKLNNEFGTEEAKKHFHLDQKISQLFVDLDETKYKITAWLADQRIYFKHNTENGLYFPILIYPSVAKEKRSLNFAIHPFFVKEYMILEKVFHIKLVETNLDSLRYSIEKVGVCTNKSKVEWYTLSIDFSKLVYGIESLKCRSCGKEIDLNDIDKIIFKKDKHPIAHREIIVDFLKERDYSDFYNADDNDILEEDGIAIAVDVKFSSLHLKNITAIINDEVHTNLIMDLIVKQPLEYTKVIMK